jgi:adenylate kinase
MSPSVPVIIITGTMGSGKTTVLGEASDILTARGVNHAGVDLDTLGSAGTAAKRPPCSSCRTWCTS